MNQFTVDFGKYFPLVPPLVVLGIFIGIFLLILFMWGTIFRRAGYSFALGLLMFIPIANLIWLLVFAFSKWPIQKELENLKREQK